LQQRDLPHRDAGKARPDLVVNLSFDDIKPIRAAANPMAAGQRIVGRQIGLIRGARDG
jgi:hypothetical protein